MCVLTVCVGDVATYVNDVGEDGRGDIIIMGGLDGEEQEEPNHESHVKYSPHCGEEGGRLGCTFLLPFLQFESPSKGILQESFSFLSEMEDSFFIFLQFRSPPKGTGCYFPG
jgi:hypothetical protein